MRIATLVFALFAPLAAFAATLENPAPVSVPTGMPLPAIRNSIAQAAAGRDWILADKGVGKLEAQLLVRQHMVKVAIAYSTQTVSISYLDSSNMDYNPHDGKPEIHGKYNKWTSTLARDIGANLSRASFK